MRVVRHHDEWVNPSKLLDCAQSTNMDVAMQPDMISDGEVTLQVAHRADLNAISVL